MVHLGWFFKVSNSIVRLPGFFCLIKIGLFYILSHFILKPMFSKVIYMAELKQPAGDKGQE